MGIGQMFRYAGTAAIEPFRANGVAHKLNGKSGWQNFVGAPAELIVNTLNVATLGAVRNVPNGIKIGDMAEMSGSEQKAYIAEKMSDKFEKKADKFERKADKAERKQADKEHDLEDQIYKLEKKADKIDREIEKLDAKLDSNEEKGDAKIKANQDRAEQYRKRIAAAESLYNASSEGKSADKSK